MDNAYDVVVVGGGAAGLNGALMLARSRRSVLVVDAGQPRNAPAEGVHGMLGHDGVPPAELLARGRDEVRRYGAEIVDATVETVTGKEGSFAVTLDDGRTVEARRVLVTTGLVDELPDIEGMRARWGRDVVHCPYCHGWEVRDQPIGVVATGSMAVHQALLFRQLSDDVVLFLNDQPDLPDDDAEQLAARGITVVTGAVAGLQIEDDQITAVRLADGTAVARSVVAVGARTAARVPFLEHLGLSPVEHASGMGAHVAADEVGRTEVPGVWVAGNATDLSAQVGAAAAAGAMAGGQINADLVAEEARAAVEARPLRMGA
ncbi:NAD(P)/FAD-dependent oxidoreductase [Mumia quercus]|uniref:NAD(P)/FAD-dependent oxidoreductase n=1 Tax=Mumia quercus TaxID=2976125 RepID=UPI0021CF9F2E|nr:NAD(P)/FAD-dependent oxidoreductase [Mumia quercus]